MKLTTLRAFHGKASIKKKYLHRVLAHTKADELVKGNYWVGGKGCAVGCTVHSGDHGAYETELGIPTWLAHLEDTIFEGLENGESKKWPAQFLRAISAGADLEKKKGPILIEILSFAREQFDKKKYPAVDRSITMVIKLWRSGGTQEQFKKAGAGARAAAYAAAVGATTAAARVAGRAAAYAAAYAAGAGVTDAGAASAYTDASATDAARIAARAATYAARAATYAAAAAYKHIAGKVLDILRS